MKRILIVLMAMMLIFTACSGGSGETVDTAAQQSAQPEQTEKEPAKEEAPAAPMRDLPADGLPAFNEKIAQLPATTMEVWLAADYFDQAPIKDAIAEFMSVYPNITVKATGIEWGEMDDKVKLAVTGEAPPDMGHQHAFALGAQGLAEDISDLWETWSEKDQLVPGSIEDVTWGGKYYGVPIDINTTILLYNKKLFEENGITAPPATMDELLETAKKLTKDDGSRYGFVTSASGWGLYGNVVAAGTDLLKYDGGKANPNLNDPKVIEVVTRYTELATKHKVSPVPPAQARQTDHPVAMFGTGRAAMFVTGPWDIARIKKEFPDEYANLATAVTPGPAGGSVMGGGSLFIPKGSKNKEASFELMKWFISDKYAVRMAEEMGRHPVKSHLYDIELYQDPLLKPYVETLQFAKPYKLEAYPEANDAWGKAIRAAFDGANPAEMLNDAQNKAQQAIDRAQN
jgi:ABC-type glycerol-3-phosphate transport system substrate-binding protein